MPLLSIPIKKLQLT